MQLERIFKHLVNKEGSDVMRMRNFSKNPRVIRCMCRSIEVSSIHATQCESRTWISWPSPRPMSGIGGSRRHAAKIQVQNQWTDRPREADKVQISARTSIQSRTGKVTINNSTIEGCLHHSTFSSNVIRPGTRRGSSLETAVHAPARNREPLAGRRFWIIE